MSEIQNTSITEIMQAAEDYYRIRKENATAAAALKTKYVGDLLKEESAKLDRETEHAKSALNEAVEQSRETMLKAAIARKNEAAEAGQKASLDSANITSDYRLLELPVTLTAQELQTLFDRHQNNPVFVRALSGYAEKHKLNHSVNFQNSHDRLIAGILDVTADLANKTRGEGGYAVLRDNPHLLQKMDDRLSTLYEATQPKA